MDTFGERMRALMAERGTSLRKLAAAVPVDAGHLSRVSRDLKPPSAVLAARIDEALDADGDLAARRPHGARLPPDDADRLRQALRRPSRIDETVAGSLAAVLAEQRRLEDAIGSALVLDTVRAQRQAISSLVTDARGPTRPQLVAVASQWAQFAGWLHIAAEDAPAARASLDHAAELAEEIGDTDMVGSVLSWKGYLAEHLGNVGPMIGLSAAAQRKRRGPGRAYDVFQEARGHALTGDVGTAGRLLDRARSAAGEANAADAREWEYYYLEPGFFDLETGATLVRLGRSDPRRNAEAVDVLRAGLAALPDGMRNSEWAGQYIVHLATAHAQDDEPEAACAAVTEAAGVARATSSGALLGQLRCIQRRMRTRWPSVPDVVQLVNVLR